MAAGKGNRTSLREPGSACRAIMPDNFGRLDRPLLQSLFNTIRAKICDCKRGLEGVATAGRVRRYSNLLGRLVQQPAVEQGCAVSLDR